MELRTQTNLVYKQNEGREVNETWVGEGTKETFRGVNCGVERKVGGVSIETLC